MFENKEEPIRELLNRLRGRFGMQALSPYGDCDDPKAVGFRIDRVEATFSVILQDQPEGAFDIQIESYPPGDYVYAEGYVFPDRFMELASLVAGPEDGWP